MSIEKLMDTECIICLELVDTQQKTKFKHCSHANRFHVDCIRTWIDTCRHAHTIPVCPICRNELVEDTVIWLDKPFLDNPYLDKPFIFSCCCTWGVISCCILSVLHL